MNGLFISAANMRWTTGLDWLGMDMRLVGFGAGVVVDPTHSIVSDFGADVLVVSDLLTGKTVTNGWACANAVRFTAPVADEPVHLLVLVEDAVDIMDAPLIAYIQMANELPFVPDGRDRFIMPDAQAGKGWIG